MARKKTLTAEQLKAVTAIMAEAFAAVNEPLPELVFDDAFLNYDWDTDLPTLPTATSKAALSGLEQLPPCGSHPICIRIPVRVIRAFKAQAARTGASYQTLINRTLNQATTTFV